MVSEKPENLPQVRLVPGENGEIYGAAKEAGAWFVPYLLKLWLSR